MRNVLLLLLILAWAANSKANLLLNGDFETSPTPNGWTSQAVNVPVTINSWTFGSTASGMGPRLEWYSSASRGNWINAPQSVNHAIQLNSDSGTDLVYAEQTFTITSLLQHTLSFYYIDEALNNAQVGVRVNITGAYTSGNQDYSYTETGVDNWRFVSYTFTPTVTGSATIRFTDMPGSNQFQNVSLDNISIVVPEPSTYAMGILLVLAVGGFHFWRRREA